MNLHRCEVSFDVALRYVVPNHAMHSSLPVRLDTLRFASGRVEVCRLVEEPSARYLLPVAVHAPGSPRGVVDLHMLPPACFVTGRYVVPSNAPLRIRLLSGPPAARQDNWRRSSTPRARTAVQALPFTRTDVLSRVTFFFALIFRTADSGISDALAFPAERFERPCAAQSPVPATHLDVPWVASLLREVSLAVR